MGLAAQRQPPRRRFKVKGAYRLMRHPVYLCFLGLIWCTPVVTLDRAVLTGLWTLYVFVGSYLKDRRLEHYLGVVYRQYEEQVPGYLFMWFGRLGRLRPSAAQERMLSQEDAPSCRLPFSAGGPLSHPLPSRRPNRSG